jgi:hypothetical protein
MELQSVIMMSVNMGRTGIWTDMATAGPSFFGHLKTRDIYIFNMKENKDKSLVLLTRQLLEPQSCRILLELSDTHIEARVLDCGQKCCACGAQRRPVTPPPNPGPGLRVEAVPK